MIESPVRDSTHPKPSEIVRGLPDERWLRGRICDGAGSFDAVGILAETAGYWWSRLPQHGIADAEAFVRERFGIPESVLAQTVSADYRSGKQAAADLLEQAGF